MHVLHERPPFLAGFGKIISAEMLAAALKIRFKGSTLDTALELVKQVES